MLELQRLKRGALAMLVGQGFLLGAGLIVTMVMTRLLGRGEMGVYFILFQVVNVSRLFSEAGMHVGLQKLIGVSLAAERPDEVRRYAQGVAIILTVFTAAAAGALWVGWDALSLDLFDEPRMVPLLGLTLFWLWMRGIEDLSSVLFRSLQEMRTVVFGVGVPRQVVLIGLLVGMWWVGSAPDLTGVISWVAVSWGVSGVLCVALVVRRLRSMPTPAGPGLRATGREILTLSLPMLMHTGAAVVLNSADIWILRIFRTAEEVGVYGAVTRFSVSMQFFVGVVNLVLPPMLARLFAEGKLAEMEHLLRRSAAWGAYLALPMMLVFVTLGGPVLDLAFSTGYTEGATALAILAVANCVNAVCGSPGFVLQMTGGHVFLMRLTLSMAALNLLGNLVVVERFGMDGLAAVSGGCLIAQNVWMVLHVKREVGVRTWMRMPWERREAARGGP